MFPIKKILNNNLVKAICINIIYMIIMFVCFEQFATYDDFTMAVQFASGVGEEYVNGHTFISPLYGRIVVFLNDLIPSLPWFNILFTFIVFICLTLLTYDILEQEHNDISLLLCNVIILFFSYEGYIGTCFTKIAGISIITGIYILLCGKKSICKVIIAITILSLGILLRNEMFIMALGATLVYIIFHYMSSIIRKKHISKKEILYVSTVMVACVLLYIVLSNEKMLFRNDFPMYQKQLEENSYRSRVHDYPMPDYYSNIEEYQKINVTPNDLFVFHGWNFDRYKLDKNVYEAIVSMEEKGPSFLESVFSIENFCRFMKEYPRNFFGMDVWYCLLIIMLVYVLLCKKENLKFIVMNCGLAVILNFLLMYYLYIQGRYNQHRVDIAIEFAIIIGFIVLCRNYMNDITYGNKKIVYSVVSIMLLLVPYTVHDDFWWGVIDKNLKQEIITFYDKTEEDKEHFYLLGNQRGQADIFMMYSLWDITKESYEDKFINTSLISNFYQTDYLKEMDIEDVYLEAVNSDKIRFVLNESNNEIAQWEEYFSHRFGEPVKLVEIQNAHWKKVYSVMTDENHLSDIEILDIDSIDGDITIQIQEETLMLKGHAYIKDKNDFGQRTFLQIKDKKTDSIKEYVLLQQMDETISENQNGRYSKLDTTINLPKWYSKDDEMTLIIENDGEYFAKKLLNLN